MLRYLKQIVHISVTNGHMDTARFDFHNDPTFLGSNYWNGQQFETSVANIIEFI